jgi:hypothetical protein
VQACLARRKHGVWTTFEVDAPGEPATYQAFAKAGGELTCEDQEVLRSGSVRVGFDRRGLQTMFIITARPLLEVFCRWEARDREFTKVGWFKPSELPEDCDGNLARTLETAFGDLRGRRTSRMPGCLESTKSLGDLVYRAGRKNFIVCLALLRSAA